MKAGEMSTKRNRKVVSLTASLLASVLAIAAQVLPANAASTSDAVIHVGSLYEPVSLDNTAGGGQGVTEGFNQNVYEGLFRLTDRGSVENALATSYKKSSSGLTYTFSLKTGVKFHSGKALTSEDVKASIVKVTATASKSARKSSLAVISGITTPDAKTVVINLSTPSISFIYNLSYIWIFNSAVKDSLATADGTGPYKFDSWTRGSTLSIVRNDEYWGTAAKNKSVVFHYFKSATALNNALLTKAVDVVTSVQSPDSIGAFKKAGFTINNGTSTTKLLMAFNDRVAPFNNAKVRKAITSAINNKALLNSIWGDYGTLTGSMVPPKDPWYENLTSVNPYDLVLAKKLLASAGYAEGFSFTLDTPTYDPHPAAAAFIKSELAKVGITVTINLISNDTWYSKVYKANDFQATLQEHVNDRDVVWYGNPNFYWGYNNPAVTALVKSAESASSIALQTSFLKRANRLIVADAASDWIYLYPQLVVASASLSGYPLNGLNSQFPVANIVKG